jgi:hypothetical protein
MKIEMLNFDENFWNGAIFTCGNSWNGVILRQ